MSFEWYTIESLWVIGLSLFSAFVLVVIFMFLYVLDKRAFERDIEQVEDEEIEDQGDVLGIEGMMKDKK